MAQVTANTEAPGACIQERPKHGGAGASLSPGEQRPALPRGSPAHGRPKDVGLPIKEPCPHSAGLEIEFRELSERRNLLSEAERSIKMKGRARRGGRGLRQGRGAAHRPLHAATSLLAPWHLI